MKFATSISTSHVEETCLTSPCTSANFSLSNFVWTASDALYPYVEPEKPNVKIDDGPAEYLDSEGCGKDCSECRSYHMSRTPDTLFNECVDTNLYRFRNQCSAERRQNDNKCMTAEPEYCFESLLADRSNKSRQVTCRTLPESYRGTLDDTVTWGYHRRRYRTNTFGQCKVNCNGTCHWSWPLDDRKRRISIKAMARCKP